jgi:hypothetical protein
MQKKVLGAWPNELNDYTDNEILYVFPLDSIF